MSDTPTLRALIESEEFQQRSKVIRDRIKAGFTNYIDAANLEYLLNQIEALLSPAEGREHNGWQPIETAPKKGDVLLWWPHWSSRATVGYWKHDRWIAENALQDSCGSIGVGPTHWMPLPAPPSAAEGRDLRQRTEQDDQ